MNSDEKIELAQLIQWLLRHEHESGKRARVYPESIIERQHDETTKWFYVPVSLAPYEHELGTFYELLSNVEEKLEEKGHNVLLVPSDHKTPAGEYAA
jgi:hypothetical protein